MTIRNYYLIVTFFLASFAYAETFSGWQSAHFTAAQISESTVSGGEADPDRDGLTNLLEYAYASDPWKAETGMLPVFGQSQNHLTLQYRRLRTAADLFMDVQATDDLAAMWTFPDNVTSTTNSSNSSYDLITLTDPQTVSGADHRFLRLTVAIDSDQDGLPDDWEMRFFGNLDQLAGGDEDFDLLTNLMEYRRGSNPTDFFNGETPVLTLTSGDAQTGFAGNDLALPLTVTVKHRDGTTVWPNAPVVFTTTSGGSFNYAASPATVTANSAGLASVTHTLSSTAGTSNITATAGKTPNTSSVTFHETASGLPPDLGPITAEGTGTDIVIGWKTTPAASGYTVQTFDSTTQQWTIVSTVGGDVSTFTDTNPNLQPGIITLYKVLGNDGTSLHAESAVEGGIKNPSENNDTDLLSNGEEVAAGSYSKERAQSLLATGNLAFGANPAGWMGPDPKLPDTDADGVLDNLDGWANDPDYSPPRLPDTHYAVINLDEWGLTPENEIVLFNDKLQLAGYTDPANNVYTLFRWDHGQKTLLNMPSPDLGLIEPYLQAMNNMGTIIGNQNSESNYGYKVVGLTWAAGNSSFVYFPYAVPVLENNISVNTDYSYYTSTAVQSINDSGQVVGETQQYIKRERPFNGATVTDYGSYRVSTRWSGGQPEVLGSPLFHPVGTKPEEFPARTDRFFYPTKINNAGWILGNYDDESREQTSTHPAVRDPADGSKTVLPDASYSYDSFAMDDASPPHVIAAKPNAFGAALWEKTAQSSWQAKEVFRGKFQQINNRGELVADYLAVNGVTQYGKTLVRNLKPVDLNQSLPPGWSDANIQQINNQGDIVGTATYQDPNTANAPAVPQAALFLPINFAEIAPSSGYDEQSTPHWLMAPEGGSTQVIALSSATTQTPKKLGILPSGSTESITPSTITNSSVTTTVTGGTVGDHSIVGFGPPEKIAETHLHISVKPYRLWTVAIHAITQRDGNGQPSQVCINAGADGVLNSTSGGDDVLGGGVIKVGNDGICDSQKSGDDVQVLRKGIIKPDYVPTESELTTYLNSVYGPQTNTYFYVIRSDGMIDYDTDRDGKLNCDAPPNSLTAEQQILKTNYNNGADFDIYYTHDFLYSRVPAAKGLALFSFECAFMKDYLSNSYNQTTAHEIGHLFGVGHSDQVPWLIKGSSDSQQRKRLMYSKGAGGYSTLLTKLEWDKICSKP